MKIVYGTPTCHKCMALKKDLTDKKEKFRYVDILSWPQEQMEKLVSKYKTMNLPIVGEEDVEN